jgi:hypothetical protein
MAVPSCGLKQTLRPVSRPLDSSFDAQATRCNLVMKSCCGCITKKEHQPIQSMIILEFAISLYHYSHYIHSARAVHKTHSFIARFSIEKERGSRVDQPHYRGFPLELNLQGVLPLPPLHRYCPDTTHTHLLPLRAADLFSFLLLHHQHQRLTTLSTTVCPAKLSPQQPYIYFH